MATALRTAAALRRPLLSACSGRGWVRSAVNVAANEPAAVPSFQHLPLGVPPPATDAAAVATKWSSDAMARVAAAPITFVPGRVAMCDGGGGSLGHPLEFIKLDAPYPAVCKYCGAKFMSSDGGGAL
ncbi:hypothetical protein MMPV_005105 [Pyropia vietnamensis]